MQAEMSWPGGRVELDLPGDESGFWKGAAEALESVPLPWKGDPTVPVTVSCALGACTLEVRGRDEAWVGGKRRPSPAIFPAKGSESGMPGLAPSSYAERHLTFASAESAGGHGSYKFYRLVPGPDGIGAEYGRIGQASGFGAPRRVKEPYPTWMYWVKYREKLLKGYVDQSEVYLASKAHVADGRDGGEARAGAESASEELYARLVALARGAVRRALAQGERVTDEQVRRSKRLLYEMGRRKTVAAFNRQLMALMQVAPRSCGNVKSMLAAGEGDFPAVLAREQSIVAAMEAVASDGSRKPRKGRRAPSFEDFGVAVERAGADGRAEAVGMLSTRLRAKVRDVFAVDHAEQSSRFESYCSRRGIDDTRLLWHGSPACNWASIVQNSLRVPGASGVAHGAMFGRGIYFGENGRGAKSAADGGGEKSWGYVGASDSYWSRGDGGEAYMALFEVAYGKPHEPSRVEGFDAARLDSLGCDCVHARAGKTGLANDEVVVYDPDAVRIRYLVRFEA